MLPPPCSHTMTGAFLGAGDGVHTLRYRQSSSLLARFCSVALAICAQRLPNLVASIGAAHLSGGTGAFQRRLPTGGFAYGMPRNCRAVTVVPTMLPWTGPSATVTVGGWGFSSVPHAAARQLHSKTIQARVAVLGSMEAPVLASRRARRGEESRHARLVLQCRNRFLFFGLRRQSRPVAARCQSSIHAAAPAAHGAVRRVSARHEPGAISVVSGVIRLTLLIPGAGQLAAAQRRERGS